MAKIINAINFEQEVLKSDMPVLVDFFATWCGPCKMIAPAIDQISDELEGQAKVFKIDVDQAKELSAQYNIRSVPTLLYFKSGEIVDKVNSVIPKLDIKAKLEAIL